VSDVPTVVVGTGLEYTISKADYVAISDLATLEVSPLIISAVDTISASDTRLASTGIANDLSASGVDSVEVSELGTIEVYPLIVNVSEAIEASDSNTSETYNFESINRDYVSVSDSQTTILNVLIVSAKTLLSLLIKLV